MADAAPTRETRVNSLSNGELLHVYKMHNAQGRKTKLRENQIKEILEGEETQNEMELIKEMIAARDLQDNPGNKGNVAGDTEVSDTDQEKRLTGAKQAPKPNSEPEPFTPRQGTTHAGQSPFAGAVTVLSSASPMDSIFQSKGSFPDPFMCDLEALEDFIAANPFHALKSTQAWIISLQAKLTSSTCQGPNRAALTKKFLSVQEFAKKISSSVVGEGVGALFGIGEGTSGAPQKEGNPFTIPGTENIARAAEIIKQTMQAHYGKHISHENAVSLTDMKYQQEIPFTRAVTLIGTSLPHTCVTVAGQIRGLARITGGIVSFPAPYFFMMEEIAASMDRLAELGTPRSALIKRAVDMVAAATVATHAQVKMGNSPSPPELAVAINARELESLHIKGEIAQLHQEVAALKASGSKGSSDHRPGEASSSRFISKDPSYGGSGTYKKDSSSNIPVGQSNRTQLGHVFESSPAIRAWAEKATTWKGMSVCLRYLDKPNVPDHCTMKRTERHQHIQGRAAWTALQRDGISISEEEFNKTFPLSKI